MRRALFLPLKHPLNTHSSGPGLCSVTHYNGFVLQATRDPILLRGSAQPEGLMSLESENPLIEK